MVRASTKGSELSTLRGAASFDARRSGGGARWTASIGLCPADQERAGEQTGEERQREEERTSWRGPRVHLRHKGGIGPPDLHTFHSGPSLAANPLLASSRAPLVALLPGSTGAQRRVTAAAWTMSGPSWTWPMGLQPR